MVIVETNRVVDKGAEVIEQEDTFPGDPAMLGTMGFSNVACMAKLL